MRRAAAALVVASALLAGCGDREPGGSPSPGASAPVVVPPLIMDGTAARRDVSLLWPGVTASGLVPRQASIFATREPADQARQGVGLLLAGAPDSEVTPPLPPGTRLTSLFVDERGIAYVSLSREAVDLAPGGSAWELLAVHSIVGSLIRAVPQVHRVQILVDGREIETLAGHVDLRTPIAFDESLVTP